MPVYYTQIQLKWGNHLKIRPSALSYNKLIPFKTSSPAVIEVKVVNIVFLRNIWLVGRRILFITLRDTWRIIPHFRDHYFFFISFLAVLSFFFLSIFLFQFFFMIMLMVPSLFVSSLYHYFLSISASLLISSFACYLSFFIPFIFN